MGHPALLQRGYTNKQVRPVTGGNWASGAGDDLAGVTLIVEK